MPKTPFRVETMTMSLRLPLDLAAWVNNEARRTGNANAAVKELVEDAQSMYGLPDVLTAQLEAEAAQLGKNRREYVAHVLALHAAELLKSNSFPSSPKSPQKKTKR